ncbi:hypothetical protein QCA50_013509 [Cerrena zonata]|uniref:Uncharacterized protein n=1 Tax=Cerrena zonata TaxID=2478898 RepID=A0AAW0G114_9APHY
MEWGGHFGCVPPTHDHDVEHMLYMHSNGHPIFSLPRLSDDPLCVISHSTNNLRCSKQDSDCLRSKMKHSADTIWISARNDRTPESWSTADFVASSCTEGIALNDGPYSEEVRSKLDNSSALIVSGFKDRAHDSTIYVSDSRNRCATSNRRDGVPKVGITVRERAQDVERPSRFFTEIYETIIDYVAERSESDDRRDLARCARVCREWLPRSQMHLFSAIPDLGDLYTPQKLVGFQDAVRRKPFLLQYIKVFRVSNYDVMPRQTTLLTSYHMRNLTRCSISRLDLKTEHSSLFKFPSSATSLRILELYSCKTEDVNQLCRFLTSFRSLSILVIRWSLGKTLGGHDLPHIQFNRSKCSLRTLVLAFTPNLSALLRSFIKAHPFVSHLKHLIISYSSDMISSFSLRDITELLRHCSQSLEELTVGSNMIQRFEYSSLLALIPLRLMSGTESDRLSDDLGYLDDILSGETFRSFRKLRIRIRESITKPNAFPKLKERNVDVDISDQPERISL